MTRTIAIDVQIGQRLKKRRVASNISQEELGARVGVTFQQIQKYERGANRISGSRLIMLCEALNIRPGTLLDDLMDQWGDPFEERSQPASALVVDMDRLKKPEVRRCLMTLVRVLTDPPN